MPTTRIHLISDTHISHVDPSQPYGYREFRWRVVPTAQETRGTVNAACRALLAIEQKNPQRLARALRHKPLLGARFAETALNGQTIIREGFLAHVVAASGWKEGLQVLFEAGERFSRPVPTDFKPRGAALTAASALEALVVDDKTELVRFLFGLGVDPNGFQDRPPLARKRWPFGPGLNKPELVEAFIRAGVDPWARALLFRGKPLMAGLLAQGNIEDCLLLLNGATSIPETVVAKPGIVWEAWAQGAAQFLPTIEEEINAQGQVIGCARRLTELGLPGRPDLVFLCKALSKARLFGEIDQRERAQLFTYLLEAYPYQADELSALRQWIFEERAFKPECWVQDPIHTTWETIADAKLLAISSPHRAQKAYRRL